MVCERECLGRGVASDDLLSGEPRQEVRSVAGTAGYIEDHLARRDVTREPISFDVGQPLVLRGLPRNDVFPREWSATFDFVRQRDGRRLA